MRQIGFGIVGSGMIAEFHARAIQATPGARLVAVYGRSPDKVASFAMRHETEAASSLEKFLSLPDLDAVCIATPTGHHAEMAIPALDAGKHVLCEKPLEVTVEKALAIVEAARRNKRILAAVFQMRFSAAALRLKKAIETGRFGRLTLCSAYIKWWRPQEYYDQGGWRGTKEIDGGGALINQGIHGIDLLQWLVGLPVEVQAHIATLAHDRLEVEDTAVALLKFHEGALGVIEGATSTWPGFSTRIEISGDRGSAILENDQILFWKFAEERKEDGESAITPAAQSLGSGAADPKAISIEGHRRQIEDLAAAIREGRSPAIPGEEALNALRLISAIYESARQGTSIQV